MTTQAERFDSAFSQLPSRFGHPLDATETLGFSGEAHVYLWTGAALGNRAIYYSMEPKDHMQNNPMRHVLYLSYSSQTGEITPRFISQQLAPGTYESNPAIVHNIPSESLAIARESALMLIEQALNGNTSMVVNASQQP